MELVNYYNYLMEECADPRTKDWFLVGSPVPIVTILLVYCYFVFVGSPNYMKGRKPYSFTTFLKFYNIFQIIVNAYILYSAATSGGLNFGIVCKPLNTSTSGDGYNMAVTVWHIYMVKLIDLLETIIFILRKKYSQVSFLHVYHHITTAFIAWICVKWVPGGSLSTVIVVNCFIHVIMYLYYLLSTGRSYLRSIVSPIKPWITILQMTQFVVMLIQVTLYMRPSCETPPVMGVIAIGDLSINLLLFYNFYKKTYLEKRRIVKCD